MYLECGPCTIRSWRHDDEERLPVHANNRKIWISLRDQFPHPYTRADAERWLQHITAESPETNFAIDVNGEAVGGIGLVLQADVERCSAEVGYWLSEQYWGRGIATAALKAITEYAFKQLNLTRVFAVPYARNDASIRVLEKAGYTCEGRLRRSAIKEGIVLDQFMYARVDDQ
ncbi:MAG TPA: GNAT family N-acetyltransferase [Pyrinomonadaceae bacterium]